MKTLQDLVDKYGLKQKVNDGFEDFICKPKTIDDIAIGDKYWTFHGFAGGNVQIVEFDYVGSGFDEVRKALGLMFLTKDDCNYFIKKLCITNKVNKYTRPFILGENNYYPEYDYLFGNIEICFELASQSNDLYFESEEKIKQAIAAVGKYDFIKYFLGVRDYDKTN